MADIVSRSEALAVEILTANQAVDRADRHAEPTTLALFEPDADASAV
jgi:hypothetical protein